MTDSCQVCVALIPVIKNNVYVFVGDSLKKIISDLRVKKERFEQRGSNQNHEAGKGWYPPNRGQHPKKSHRGRGSGKSK
jgi:hypothetical protein